MKLLPQMLLAILLFMSVAYAKDAGDLLEQYLNNPKEAVHTDKEFLALVEIESVDTDATPDKPWKQSGTLHLRLLEAVGGELPNEFTVRFYKRVSEGEDAWTWDYVVLEKGKRLLGFFNKWQGKWAVREDGRHNVINNPENIQDDLLIRVQQLFKTILIPRTKQKQAP